MELAQDTIATNARGDIVARPTGLYASHRIAVTIPHPRMAKITNATTTFYGTLIAAAIASLAGIITAVALNLTALLLPSFILLFAIMTLFFLVLTPTTLASIGAQKMLIPPKYFSDQNTPQPTWETKHQEEFLELLNNDLTRSDFIQLLEAVNNDSVTPEKSQEIYNNMKKVGLTKKENVEKAIDNMLEKYKAYAETFHELENI